jgi:hypothetical protein
MQRIVLVIIVLIIGMNQLRTEARTFSHSPVRYMGAEAQALGGVSLPLSNEVMQNLFSNPAALAKSHLLKAEFLNLNLEANGGMIGTAGLSTLTSTSLSGLKTTLAQNPGTVVGSGFSVGSALSFGGFGFGVLVQERVRAVIIDSNTKYETVSQAIPTVAYAASLARGVVRFGYSLQYVNQTSGQVTTPTASATAFMKDMNVGRGLSQNASVNFSFPFTYLPTLSFAGRNIGGLHFTKGSLLSRASNVTGTPQDEPMAVDAAFSALVKLTGTFATNWYFEFRDLTASGSTSAFLNKLSMGMEFNMNKSLMLRGGLSGTRLSAGLGYIGDHSAINFAWYHEPNTVGGGPAYDTRYQLQYVFRFQKENKRDPEKERTP